MLDLEYLYYVSFAWDDNIYKNHHMGMIPLKHEKKISQQDNPSQTIVPQSF
ncbi:hypothetical protein LguiB_013643 [Lonicera macranthoides]